MTTRPNHRTLTSHVRGWSVDQIARLVQRRPDLVHPAPPADVAELAQRAQQQPSVERAIAATTLPENRLLQLVVCCRPDARFDELAAALPEGVGLADIEAVLVSLEEAALVWRHDGRLHCSGTLRQAMPTTLGPPVHLLLKHQSVDYVRAAIRLLRASLPTDGVLSGAIPAPATGPGGRPARKAELTDELESLLAMPGLVDAVLRQAPDECAGMAVVMAEERPVIALDIQLHFSRYTTSSYYHDDPANWLFERALLLPLLDTAHAVQPREVGVALRGGRPVADLALHRPALTTGTLDQAAVDVQAAERVARTLSRLADLLDRWAGAPVPMLKSGGLGATVLKQTAAAIDADLDETARLVELANLAGLIDTTTVTRKEKRKYVYETSVGPSSAAAGWLARPPAERWATLAAAWLRAEHWPSASGRKSPDTKAIAVLTPQYATTAPDRRRDVLDTLASLHPGQATTPDVLARYVYWTRPQAWLSVGDDRGSSAISWVHDEAELLGGVAKGALSTFGRALLGGDRAGAETAIEAGWPPAVRSFTLQADLTATVVGSLDRDVLVELRLVADVESTGAATTFRFSEASLRRAIDAGRDADAIVAFLEAHAAKGVPKPLAYLVGDVARRYGHLQVGTAASFVTSDDPAILADACTHRRTRTLRLRLLAPTVAVSHSAPARVVEGLREAGFLPTVDGDDTAAIAVSARTAPSSPGEPAPGKLAVAGELPERFRTRGGAHEGRVPPVPELAAAKLAEAILAGPQRPNVLFGNFPSAPGTAGRALVEARRTPADDGPSPLDELLELTRSEPRVIGISIGDGQAKADPIVLAVTGWDGHQVVGIDLEDGTTTSILYEHIGAAVDIGPIDEVVDDVWELGGFDTPRRPPRRHRARGRRR